MCISIYSIYGIYRQSEFRKRLQYRALTTVNLFIKVTGSDKDLLKKIDETSFLTLQQKSVIIYDSLGKEIYNYADEKATVIKANKEIISQAKNKGTYYFSAFNKDVVAIAYKEANTNYVVIAAALDKDGQEIKKKLFGILAISFCSGVLLTFIAGLFFSKTIVIPIKKITNDVKEISSQNLTRRLAVTKPKDELNELALTFNDLMNRLQESFEIQRRFISNASHELSTPLTSISSQLEIILQSDRTNAEYKEVLLSVYEDVKQLTQLTKSLLEMAKASGTAAGIELSLIRIDELLMKLPSEFKKIDSKFSVHLNFDSFPEDEDMLFVFGNHDLLYSAVKNIITNACKYSTEHTAYVSLHFSDLKILITIEDNGPGINASDKAFLFDPFYRGKNIGIHQGFGLGLSLAKRIMSIHRGNISFTNKPEGGVLFTIELPIGKVFYSA